MTPREAAPYWLRFLAIALLLLFVFYRGLDSFSFIEILGIPAMIAFMVFYDRIHNFLNRK